MDKLAVTCCTVCPTREMMSGKIGFVTCSIVSDKRDDEWTNWLCYL